MISFIRLTFNVKWQAFVDSSEKAPWLFLYDESSGESYNEFIVWLPRDRHMKTPLWSQRIRGIVNIHHITSQLTHVVTFRWQSFEESTVKSSWALLCDKSPDNIILMSLGHSSETSDHCYFTIETLNNGEVRVTRW